MRINVFGRGTAIAAIGAAAGLALALPAWAAEPGNPPGANGTVKIDASDDGYDNDDTKNEPHVTCEFRVELENFDADERGNIVLLAQPPSGGDFGEVVRNDDVELSPDDAGGAKNDPDDYYTYSADDLDLSLLFQHPVQGYHIKLSVEREGKRGEKHKVFWLLPCESTSTSSPTPSESESSSSAPTESSSTSSPSPSMVGVGNEGENGGLPVTGAAASTAAAVGLGLVGGGAALMIRRRRRFTA